MLTYTPQRFGSLVDKALDVVRRVLDRVKHPHYATDTTLAYEDTFTLVELLTNVALASQSNSLTFLGLNQTNLDLVYQWSKERSVTLRFATTEECELVKKDQRKVESPSSVTQYASQTVTKKVVTTIDEFHWKIVGSYELSAIRGNDTENKVSTSSALTQN